MSNEDPYLNPDITLERLKHEWKKYGSIIIAFDFDDTVYDFHKKGYTYNKVVNLLRRARDIGAYFIVHTACGADQEDFIRQYLTDNDIPFDSVNKNAPYIDTTGRKCYYNILLDDRAGLESSYNTLLNAVQFMEEARRVEHSMTQ